MIFVLFAAFLSISVHAYDFKIPDRFCLISSSLNASLEALTSTQSILNNRLGAKCERASETWGHPFLELKKYSSDPSLVFVFFVDKDLKTSDLVIRGLDPQISLQWGIVTARIEGLSAGSQRAVLEDAIDRLIRQFPFVGFMDDKKFFTWATEDISQLQFFRIKSYERHPFLPQILAFSREAGSRAGWALEHNDGVWSLMAPSKPGLSAKNSGRLWLGTRSR